MVAIHRDKTSNFRLKHVVSCFIFFIVVLLIFPSDRSYYIGSPVGHQDFVTTRESRDSDVQAMKNWRNDLKRACQNFIDEHIQGGNITGSHLQVKEKLEAEALRSLYIPDASTLTPSPNKRRPYKFCKHVFVDLGTNR